MHGNVAKNCRQRIICFNHICREIKTFPPLGASFTGQVDRSLEVGENSIPYRLKTKNIPWYTTAAAIPMNRAGPPLIFCDALTPLIDKKASINKPVL